MCLPEPWYRGAAVGCSDPLETEAGQRMVTQGHVSAQCPKGALSHFNQEGKGWYRGKAGGAVLGLS